MIKETPKYIGYLLERYDKGEREFPNCDFRVHESLQFLILDNSNMENSKFFSANFKVQVL